MDKTIYRIRGNVFFKLAIYILIAVLAFGTFCIGGLVVEGAYIGQFSNDPRNEVYKKLVGEYANDNCSSMTDAVSTNLEDKWNQMKKAHSYENLLKFDSNGDGVMDSTDLVSSCTDYSITRQVKATQSYKRINSRGDTGFELSVKNSSDTSENQQTQTFKTGMTALINENGVDTGNIEKYTYDTGLELRTYKYLAFDTMQEMSSMKKEIENAMASVDGYYEEDDNYTDYAENAETPATTETEAADAQDETASPDIYKGSYVYRGSYPTMVDVMYMDGAYTDGAVVPNGYVLLLGYDDYSYVNLSGTAYVDMDAAIDNTKKESPELAVNVGKWVNYYKKILACFAILAVMCIVCIVVSMINAGVKTGENEISLTRIERVPTELVTALAASAIIAGTAICIESGIIDICTSGINRDCSFVTDNMGLYIIAVPVACLYSIAVLFLNNLVAKFKAGVLLNDCLIIRIVKWFGRKCVSRYRYVRNHLSLTAQGVAIYVCITIAEIILLIILAASSMMAGLYVFMYIVIKWLCIVGIVAFLIQTQELYKCAKEMAGGNLSRKADTRKMFWIFRAHGEHLNQISDGMSKAVDERMKSEHLKTELITNVSHDIKTPLTSIINYVDLLQNDDLDEKTRQEYIAVLSRQSARLKKLIEDLVEASKASTGNVQINWAEIDANMLLEQAVAEYEDKLRNAGLKVVFTKSGTPAYIKADGQHLWRVFDNLLANISKYAMSGTRVYTSVVHEADKVRIEFKNISREALNVSSEELMERFVRGDSSRNTEGSGLGLSIANSLCGLMNAGFSLNIDGDLFKAIIVFDDVTPNNSNEEANDAAPAD